MDLHILGLRTCKSFIEFKNYLPLISVLLRTISDSESDNYTINLLLNKFMGICKLDSGGGAVLEIGRAHV